MRRSGSSSYDPRGVRRTVARDIAAATFIGRFAEVAGYQLDAAIFTSAPASARVRFTHRWKSRGLIAVERFNGFGVNRYRLLPPGRDYLASKGVDPRDLFVLTKPLRPKDLAHHYWTVDIAVALMRSANPPDAVLTAAAIQRRFSPRPPVIPDLLAVSKPASRRAGVLVAIEIDLGGESLRAVFLPKLLRLSAWLGEVGAGSPTAGLVMTSSARRAAGIARGLQAGAVAAPIFVERLPAIPGAAGLSSLSELLALSDPARAQILPDKSRGESEIALPAKTEAPERL